MMISAVVLSKNEERNIKDCLQSIKDLASEIIIIDDYSTDKTLKIAKDFGAKVFLRHLNDDFSGQRNFGLEKAKNKWVMFLDADERVTDELAQEITTTISKNEDVNGYFFKRNDFFGERILKYGEIANVRLLRLAKKDSGSWQRKVHETWDVKGQTKEFKNPLLHYPHSTITAFLKEINFYSSLHAESLKKEGMKPSLLRLIFNPLAKFISNYFLKKGFLDGTPGLITALMMSFHSFLARGKLFNL